MKKHIWVLLALTFVAALMLLCGTALAETIVDSGTCGTKIKWQLNSAGELIISGKGKMKDYSFDSINPWYSDKNSISKITIQDGVTSIGSYAFYQCYNLESISIPSSVTSIGQYALYYCESLTSVSIPNKVTSIGDFAFSYCTDLENINIPNKVTNIGEYAFSDCRSLASISLPDSVASLGNNAFRECSSLESVSIGSGVMIVDFCTFYGCESLVSISIPDSVTSIGNGAFSHCSSLESASIGNGVTSMGSDVFSKCSSLESISIGSSVTSIGEYAFEKCSNLKKVYIPSLEAWLGISFKTNASANPMYYADELYIDGKLLTELVIPDGVTKIKFAAFYNCSSLTNVSIPDGVVSIGQSAFTGCSSLESVSIGNDVTSIGSYAFYNCSSLMNISIPDSVVEIGKGTFQYCSSLESVSIGNGVTSIGNSAFFSCRSLRCVSIPDSVSSIGDQAFYYSAEIIKFVFFGDDMPTMGSSVFYYSPIICCYEYSDVDYWAMENGYTTVYIDDMDFTVPMEVMLPKGCTLAVGESMQVSAAVFPAQKDAQITWVSSDPAVVSVENGKLTALSVGETTIIAACGSASDSMTVITYALTESFELSAAELWMVGKTSGQLSVQNIQPTEAAPSFTWSSSNTSILTVSASGELLALKPGDATVTATSDNGLVQECLVHVCYSVTAIEFEDAEKEVFLGSTAQLTANVNVRTQNLVNKLVTFASSDPEIASVDKSGAVTGHQLGTVQITAAAESGVSAICTVQVREMNVFALPEATKEIQTEAFLNSTVECIVLPDGCETIGSRAFAGCDKLVYIHIPDSVISIADDAFDGCSKFTIRCSESSLAAEYALERGISIDFIS